MDENNKSEWINAADIKINESLVPKKDELFIDLLRQAIDGKTPLYYGSVPIGLCIPFDPDYRPDTHPIGMQAIDQTYNDALAGNMQPLFVYQRGYWFVVSDDYITLFVALRGLLEYVPCWIIGMPNHDLVKDIEGPIAKERILRILGFA